MEKASFDVRTWRPTRVHYIGALALSLSLLAIMGVDRMLAGSNDFAHFYIGGRLFGSPNIHSPEVNVAMQKELIGGVLKDSYFVRPTFYGVFYKPLAGLPYPTAYLVFQAVALIACFFFVRWNVRRIPGFAALALMFPPLLANFVNGQDVIFLVTLCTLSMMWVEGDRDFRAGLLLSLCAFKPHLFVLVPLAAGFHRRWRFVAGAATGLTTLFLIGLVAGGWEAQRQLFELLRNPNNSPFAGIMPNWRSVDPSGGPVYLALCLATVVAVGFLAYRASSFPAAFAWCVVGGLLISFHAYMQDCLFLLFALAVLAKDLPRLASLAHVVAILPLPYFLLQWGPPFSAAFVMLAACGPALAVWDALGGRESPAPRGRVAVAGGSTAS